MAKRFHIYLSTKTAIFVKDRAKKESRTVSNYIKFLIDKEKNKQDFKDQNKD